VHLVELLRLRSQPFAGLFLGLTRRCPLHCAHCSTASTIASEESPAAWYEHFASTFTAGDRPDIALLSGGEPLLRPQLVTRLTEQCHTVGTRVALLTGSFWGPRAPSPAVQRAMDAVDLLSVSMDVFHEQEVPRASVFATIERRLDRGTDVSVQTVGAGPDDPWVAQLVDEIDARFDRTVPILVGPLGPSGRERATPGAAVTSTTGDRGETAVAVRAPTRSAPRGEDVPLATDVAPEPCGFASWPVAGFDGTITACCQQSVVDDAPGHLRLGHLTTDAWPEIRARGEAAAILRAIRVYGPQHLAARAGRPVGTYCGTCRALDGDPTVEELAERLTSTAGFAITAELVADALGVLPLRGVPDRYRSLVDRGAPVTASVARSPLVAHQGPAGIEGW
jgi:pyruvate-formate lyase-activating enzyme